jgi:hypothetical protein
VDLLGPKLFELFAITLTPIAGHDLTNRVPRVAVSVVGIVGTDCQAGCRFRPAGDDCGAACGAAPLIGDMREGRCRLATRRHVVFYGASSFFRSAICARTSGWVIRFV